MVRGVATWAKLCTVTVFQREKERKKKIGKKSSPLIKTKWGYFCLKSAASMRRDSKTGTDGTM